MIAKILLLLGIPFLFAFVTYPSPTPVETENIYHKVGKDILNSDSIKFQEKYYDFSSYSLRFGKWENSFCGSRSTSFKEFLPPSLVDFCKNRVQNFEQKRLRIKNISNKKSRNSLLLLFSEVIDNYLFVEVSESHMPSYEIILLYRISSDGSTIERISYKFKAICY